MDTNELREIDYQIAEKFKKWRIEPLSNWPDCYPFCEDRTEKYRVVKWIEDPEDPVCRIINEDNNIDGDDGCTEIPTFSIDDYESLQLLKEVAEKNYVELYSYHNTEPILWKFKINLDQALRADTIALTICLNILQAIELKTLVT